MSRLTNQVRPQIATLVACGLFGLAGGSLYGSCAVDECTTVVFHTPSAQDWCIE
jgi:hypothetical protein